MTAETESRRKTLGRFGLRLVSFVVLAALVLSYVIYVLTPKCDYGICGMMNLYRQPKNTVDVLVVGTSLAYAGVNTNVLWDEYGLAVYDLCSAEQPFWVSYYTIREALKTQSPRVILLDAQPSVYTRDYTRRGRTILSTFGIRGLENRIGAQLACVETASDAVGYILGIPQVHAYYETLTAADLRFPPDNGGRGVDWKGYIEVDEVESHRKPSFVWNSVRRNMNDREEEYARRIMELCRDEGVELMLLGMPTPDYASDHQYYNALWSLAEEYGVTGINYNDPDLRFGLRYSTDFADWQHLNVKGSVTFSRQLGADLRSRFDLPDRRSDPAYDSYERCASAWWGKYHLFASSGLDEEGT